METKQQQEQPPIKQRVLSIQSHVVHGYVGNKAAVFPLQLLGYDVDFINSVHFSCHTGYQHFPHGEIMDGTQLRTILEGLEVNGLLGNSSDEDPPTPDSQIGSILTGYIGSVSFLEAVIDVIECVRKYNPNVKYVCDPVLGDDGAFYVPEELVNVYKTVVFPKADIVTPNQFETEQLTGIEVKTFEDARQACLTLHKIGPSVVFITSALLEGEGEDDKAITIIASKSTDKGSTQQMWRIDCPIIPGSFTGTGDVTASLLLGHLQDLGEDNLPLVMEKVINTMYVLILRTHVAKGKTAQSKELKLIRSKDIIENPPATYKAQAIKK